MIPAAITRKSVLGDLNAAFGGDPGVSRSPKEAIREIPAAEKPARAVKDHYPDELLGQLTGQNATDIDSYSTDIGSDNQVDYELKITNLSPQDQLHNDITLTDPATGTVWASQPNPGPRRPGYLAADFIPDTPNNATSGIFYFQPPPTGDELSNLTITAHYYTPQTDTSTPFTISYQADDPMPAPASYALASSSITATWIDQTTQSIPQVVLGSVDVGLAGLPTDTNHEIRAIALSNVTNFLWVYQAPGFTLNNSSDVTELSLNFVPSTNDPTKGDLYFAPNRNEVDSTIQDGSPLLLHIVFADGSSTLIPFSGGYCDPNLYDPVTSFPATPHEVYSSDAPNLQSIVNSYPWVQLASGTYDLGSQLVLSTPVTITTDQNAQVVLQFTTPPATASTWFFIDVESSHVHLSGFSVDISGPVAVGENDAAPSAAVGIYAPGNTPLVDIQIAGLKITIPLLSATPSNPVPDYEGFVAISTDATSCGTIEGNTQGKRT